MAKLICDLYRVLFARKIFYKLNKLLYMLSLRGLGILNYETSRQTGEDYFIRHQLTGVADGVVLDVGGNVGNYARNIRSTNKNVHIYTFEPHPITYQKLIRNVEQLNIKTINVGVGSNNGILTLYDYASNDGSAHASLHKDVIEVIHNKEQTIAHEVKVISLDSFAVEYDIDRVDLLKIDTEGHELEVLKGFERHIRNNKVDLIHFEFNEMNIISRVFFKDIWDFLPNYNFFRMLPDGLVPMKQYSPVFCEIFAYQNIVAKLKDN